MKFFKVNAASLCLVVAMAGLAQEKQSTPNIQSQPQPTTPESTPGWPLPVDLAGYVNFRYVNDDALQEHDFYRDYSASLFISKTVGRWRFHSEFNADTAPEYDSEGIHLLPRRPSLSVKLDSGFANYNVRDWFQVQAGLLFVPTYWRTHRYQSTTLTVDEPLIDQNVFPTALKGGAVYGDKYWRDGGVSYIAYGGVDQQAEFGEKTQNIMTDRSTAIGGKLTLHVPSRQFFKTLDIAVHRLHRAGHDGNPDEVFGTELVLRKDRFEVLAEFAHASLDLVNGVRTYIRQGYYIQPSYRITPRLFAVARYNRLDRDSRYADQSRLDARSAGLTYRPVPTVSLKIEGDRYEQKGTRAPAYYGVTGGVVWFFHLP